MYQASETFGGPQKVLDPCNPSAARVPEVLREPTGDLAPEITLLLPPPIEIWNHTQYATCDERYPGQRVYSDTGSAVEDGTTRGTIALSAYAIPDSVLDFIARNLDLDKFARDYHRLHSEGVPVDARIAYVQEQLGVMDSVAVAFLSALDRGGNVGDLAWARSNIHIPDTVDAELFVQTIAEMTADRDAAIATRDAELALWISETLGIVLAVAEDILHDMNTIQDTMDAAAKSAALAQLVCYWLNYQQTASCDTELWQSPDWADQVDYEEAVKEALMPENVIRSYINQEAADAEALAAARAVLNCLFVNDPVKVDCREKTGNEDNPNYEIVKTDVNGSLVEGRPPRLNETVVARGLFVSRTSKQEANAAAKAYGMSLLVCYYISEQVEMECGMSTARPYKVDPAVEPPTHADYKTRTPGQRVFIPEGAFVSETSTADATAEAEALAPMLLRCCFISAGYTAQCEPFTTVLGMTEIVVQPDEDISRQFEVTVEMGQYAECDTREGNPSYESNKALQEKLNKMAELAAKGALICAYCNIQIQPTCVPAYITQLLSTGVILEEDLYIEAATYLLRQDGTKYLVPAGSVLPEGTYYRLALPLPSTISTPNGKDPKKDWALNATIGAPAGTFCTENQEEWLQVQKLADLYAAQLQSEQAAELVCEFGNSAMYFVCDDCTFDWETITVDSITGCEGSAFNAHCLHPRERFWVTENSSIGNGTNPNVAPECIIYPYSELHCEGICYVDKPWVHANGLAYGMVAPESFPTPGTYIKVAAGSFIGTVKILPPEEIEFIVMEDGRRDYRNANANAAVQLQVNKTAAAFGKMQLDCFYVNHTAWSACWNTADTILTCDQLAMTGIWSISGPGAAYFNRHPGNLDPASANPVYIARGTFTSHRDFGSTYRHCILMLWSTMHCAYVNSEQVGECLIIPPAPPVIDADIGGIDIIIPPLEDDDEEEGDNEGEEGDEGEESEGDEGEEGDDEDTEDTPGETPEATPEEEQPQPIDPTNPDYDYVQISHIGKVPRGVVSDTSVKAANKTAKAMADAMTICSWCNALQYSTCEPETHVWDEYSGEYSGDYSGVEGGIHELFNMEYEYKSYNEYNEDDEYSGAEIEEDSDDEPVVRYHKMGIVPAWTMCGYKTFEEANKAAMELAEQLKICIEYSCNEEYSAELQCPEGNTLLYYGPIEEEEDTDEEDSESDEHTGNPVGNPTIRRIDIRTAEICIPARTLCGYRSVQEANNAAATLAASYVSCFSGAYYCNAYSSYTFSCNIAEGMWPVQVDGKGLVTVDNETGVITVEMPEQVVCGYSSQEAADKAAELLASSFVGCYSAVQSPAYSTFCNSGTPHEFSCPEGWYMTKYKSLPAGITIQEGAGPDELTNTHTVTIAKGTLCGYATSAEADAAEEVLAASYASCFSAGGHPFSAICNDATNYKTYCSVGMVPVRPSSSDISGLNVTIGTSNDITVHLDDGILCGYDSKTAANKAAKVLAQSYAMCYSVADVSGINCNTASSIFASCTPGQEIATSPIDSELGITIEYTDEISVRIDYPEGIICTKDGSDPNRSAKIMAYGLVHCYYSGSGVKINEVEEAIDNALGSVTLSATAAGVAEYNGHAALRVNTRAAEADIDVVTTNSNYGY